MQTIKLNEDNKIKKSKAKAWELLGKENYADELQIIEKGEKFTAKQTFSVSCVGKFGYDLIWKTKEDDIHVWGDGVGSVKETCIFSDNPIASKESLDKFRFAMICFDTIEKNRKKYY